MGNVAAGSVRIYKFNTLKTFTKEENELYNNGNKSELAEKIKNYAGIRTIDSKYLNEKFEISVFENDVVRLALADRGENKAEFQLLDEIVYMKIHNNEIMKQIIEKGLEIASEDYIFYTATTGQVRDKTITLIKKEFFKNHKESLLVGLNKEIINEKGGMNSGKYLSYIALPLSLSVLPENEIDIDRCMLVKGLETIVTDKVKYIDIQGDCNGQLYVADTPKDYITKSISIEHTDGAGMFLPGKLPSSCQIRGGYFKGAIFPFDFKKFATEVAHNTKIKDAWGNEFDIEKDNIEYIFTTSQLKMWKMYESWDDYKRQFKKHKLKLSINSYAPLVKDTVNFSYQYLMTLPFGCNIEKLCSEAKDDLVKLHKDFEYLKENMGYDDSEYDEYDDEIDDKEIDNGGYDDEETDNESKGVKNTLIGEALKIYPELINDTYVKNKIQKMVQARRRKYLAGKIPLRGYYSYIVPDMYAFCEYLFKNDESPEGLIPKNRVYNKYYTECENVENVICLRSPHLSRYEYVKRRLEKTEECKKWFQYMDSDTVVSCHDLISKSLQCDWDGDKILISADEELYNLAESLPDAPLFYDMQQAQSQQITNETIYDTLIKGFENNVIGESSNCITKLWNTPKATEKNPIPYDDAINVFCAYSNYAIDYPKTGKNLALGKYQELYDKLIPNKTNPFAKSEIKYPNFFIEAKNKRKDQVEKLTDNVVDRVKKYIADGTGKLRFKYFMNSGVKIGNFDYRMLMNNEISDDGSAQYKVNRYSKKYKELYSLLKYRKDRERWICQHVKDEQQKYSQFKVFYYRCIQEIKKIFTSKGHFDVDLAVNYFIDLEYSKHEFITSSKNILWECFGYIILRNIQRNTENGTLIIKVRPRMSYMKTLRENKELDNIIEEKLKMPSIDITKSELNFINEKLQKHKNGKVYINDKALLYTLYCLYKNAKNREFLKDGYLIIVKRQHVVKVSTKSNDKRKRKIGVNMKRVMEIAEAKSYTGSLKRFADTEGIEIIDDTDKNCYKIKFTEICQDEVIFTVKNVYNPMPYLLAYEQDKKICVCEVCGKDFIKAANNQKTCTDKCKEELHRWNQARANEVRKHQKLSS